MKTLPEDILTELESVETLPILKLNPESLHNQDPIEETLVVFQQSLAAKPIVDPTLLKELSQFPTHEIHRRIRKDAKISEDFVDKLVAFHVGHFTLTLDDLMDYLVHLDRVFAHFAHHCPGFHELNPNDQSLLLMSNTSLYFQLHMARYINAGNGLDQVKALLGTSLPEDLENCDKFMTISFKYFASAMRLFQEELWLESYNHYASRLKENPLTFDEMAACILFLNPQVPFEEPNKVRSLGNQVLSQMSCTHSVKDAMISLRAMVQFYAHGSTCGFATGESFINSTEISFSSVPSFQSSDEEEIFWMERQLKKCTDTSKKEVNVGTDVINDLVLYFHDQLDVLDVRIQQIFVETLFKRCNAMLLCHHEYRKLSQNKSYRMISNTIYSNFTKAVTFLLAYIDILEPREQLGFLFGDNDIQLCPPLYESVKKIQIPSKEVLSKFSITPEDIEYIKQWLKSLNTQFVSPRIIILITLTILWRNNLEISDTHDFYSQIASIRERYRMYLIHTLEKDFDMKNIDNFVNVVAN